MAPHLKLVKTKYARLIRQISRNRFNRITPLITHILLHSMNTFMHVNHERMKMYSSFASDVGWESLVEEVH